MIFLDVLTNRIVQKETDMAGRDPRKKRQGLSSAYSSKCDAISGHAMHGAQ